MTERSWRGMKCHRHSFAAQDVARVSTTGRRGVRGHRDYAVVFEGKDKCVLFRRRFSLQLHAHNWRPKTEAALASGGAMPFRDWTFPHMFFRIACAVGFSLPLGIKWRRRKR